MTFTWNDDTIRWYKEANDYTGFYKNVAAAVLPMLAGHNRLCDIGCGLGLVDLELASGIERIDCIDISEAAIASLVSDIKRLGIKTINPIHSDIDNLSNTFDVLLMSFFGAKKLDAFLPLCKKIISVVNDSDSSHHMVSKKQINFERFTVASTEEYLIEMNINYKLTRKSFEFGQPFVSKEDANKFIRKHSPNITASEAEKFFFERIIELDNEQYSYFMPHQKRIGIFEINGQLKVE